MQQAGVYLVSGIEENNGRYIEEENAAKAATGVEEVKVSFNGSLEIKIGTRKFDLLPWTCLNHFTLVRDDVTGTAT